MRLGEKMNFSFHTATSLLDGFTFLHESFAPKDWIPENGSLGKIVSFAYHNFPLLRTGQLLIQYYVERFDDKESES